MRTTSHVVLEETSITGHVLLENTRITVQFILEDTKEDYRLEDMRITGHIPLEITWITCHALVQMITLLYRISRDENAVHHPDGLLYVYVTLEWNKTGNDTEITYTYITSSIMSFDIMTITKTTNL